VNIRTLDDEFKAAEGRYAEREEARAETLRKLERGGILAADTPERVEKRLARLGADVATAESYARGAFPVPAAVSGGNGTHAVAPAPADAAATMAEPGEVDFVALERLLGANNLINVAFLEAGAQAARAVGRIVIGTEHGGVAGYGTGSLVGPRLLLTNNHVLVDSETAARSQVEFGYELALDGTPSAATSFRLDPAAFFLTDRELDYTLVAVAARGSALADLDRIPWNRLIEVEGKAILGELLNIVQHPNGEPKQLAMRENKLVDLLDNFLHYQTDTSPGSSGSPVFNDQWEIVGLHHSGVPRRDESGRIVAISGEPWTRAMGEHRIDWIANEGVRVSRIIKHIKRKRLGRAQSRLRARLFDDAPPVNGRGAVEVVSEAPPTVTRSGDTMVWTVPLHVTVQIGVPSVNGAGEQH
jgi:endonuclease G